MKKWLCILLMVGVLLCGMALAENELPVLTAQLGAAAEMTDSSQNGDEYQQTLTVDAAQVTMGRYAGEISAEEMAQRVAGEIREGEMLVDGEGGIDQRAVFLTGSENASVADATVIWLDGYTYAFVCVVDSDAYYGQEFSAQVDAWVDTLDVFDGEISAEADPNADIMLLYEGELYDAAELTTAESIDEDTYYMELVAADGLVKIGEYTMPGMTNTEDMEAALLDVARTIHADASDFFYEQSDAMTQQLAGYPAYLCSWSTGANEDLRQCRALIVAGGQTLVLYVSVDEEYFMDYESQIEDLFASASIYVSDEQLDVASVQAEEIGYSLFGEYAEFVYVWDETFEDGEYCVYEFVDEDEATIGLIAVQPETGAAYVSFSEDTLEPMYEAVLWDDDTGYYVEDSVG